MNTYHKNAQYTTTKSQDVQEGWSVLDLYRTVGGVAQLVARMVFWDGEGQFSLEMRVPELPLKVVEELIDEARATIKIK